MRRQKHTNWITALFLLLAIAGACRPAQAQERTLTWVLSHFPPFRIMEGPDTGQGFADRILADFQKKMPGFKHRVLKGPLARALQMMEQQDGVCRTALLFKPSRAEVALYSDPVFGTPGAVIVASPERSEVLRRYQDENGILDLEAVLQETDLNFGAARDRSYSPSVDRILADNQARIFLTTHYTALLTQLHNGALDLAIAYPFEAEFLYAGFPDRKDFNYIPIKGYRVLKVNHFACSKGPAGQAAIARINEIIGEAGPRPPWLNYIVDWLPPGAADQFASLLDEQGPWRKR